ncbi:SagB/ThcOx family dehydrogenase [Pseudodesulfovibrio piezophilus]|uniref:Nitroreductase n=1 Tax=Pseudodesulfovibrio piezophilus (strain DSM 21447 / JCM 15486 / C1TLV30) TaxID=1322246 RepID=M1WX66_PSEP2|nr:SagB family peptide dehydrogenase [Pseudodesulfovibrio piezophilus]CCH49543.1 Nitroreductase [Pseudodesulfovibrio piezophilus C1TLV30]
MVDISDPVMEYHTATSHSRGHLFGRPSLRGAMPLPFKLYQGIEHYRFPQGAVLPDIPLASVFAPRPLAGHGDIFQLVGNICNLAAGITRVRYQTDGSLFHFRTVPSAGALYPTELFIAVQNIVGLYDGLYHYLPLEHTLARLRTGRVFGPLAGTDPIVRVYVTSLFQRSSWKYGARAYRYCLLDAGHMIENVLLAATIQGGSAVCDPDFNDRLVNRFLCVDPDFEGCLAQIHSLGCSPQADVDDSVPTVTDSLAQFSRSPMKTGLPESLLAMHRAASSFARCPVPKPKETELPELSLPPHDIRMPAADALVARRSHRNFVRRQVPVAALTDILSFLCQEMETGCTHAVQIEVIAGENSGMEPGHYRMDRVRRAMVAIRGGHFMAEMAKMCLDQGWLAECALHIVFTADLGTLSRQCGPRAYRYAHLEAGRLGQRVYLAATAKHLGACGIGAFFDDEAVSILSLPPGHALLYLVGVGPIKR